MATDFHSPTPEALMEYLDGEGTPTARADIAAHLAACPSCQALAGEHRQLSRQAQAWTVEPAPASLRPPSPTVRAWPLAAWLQRPRAAVLTFSAAAVVLVGISTTVSVVKRAAAPQPERPAEESRAFDRVSGGAGGGVGRGPVGFAAGQAAPRAIAEQAAPSGPAHVQAVIRTATLQLVATDFGSVRGAVERIVAEAQGFADQLGVSSDPAAARVLRATLRVPGDRLTDALTRLRALGQVTQDQQNAQDVADQIVDLDARMKNARATEQRLTDLLKNRTGKLSDVLEVEQEVSRVRLEIEQLDAQKTNMNRRVAYATIDLTINEERKAGLVAGPLPLLTQVRVAAADGLQNVIDTVVGISLFVLRAGPMLILWGIAGGIVWTAVKRLRRRARPA
jgi:Domain of unknown function (DUF4349)/Putative zinc-finger